VQRSENNSRIASPHFVFNMERLNQEKNKMENHMPVSQELYKYLLDHSLREPPQLVKIREETASHPKKFYARMQTAPDEAQFMGMLVKLMNAKNVIELGVFTGYSSLAVALNLPADGKMIACDVNEEYTAVAKKFWKEAGVDHKIDLRLAPAVDTLDQLIKEGRSGQFDFAFIDADKTNYDNYYERLLQLIRIGGLIVIDNVFWGGGVMDPNINDDDTVAIRNLNNKIKDDSRVQISMLGIADGVTLAMRIK